MKEKQDIPPVCGEKESVESGCPFFIGEAGLSRQFYVLQARKTIPKLPESYSEEKCLRLLRKHAKRMIRSLSVLPSIIDNNTDDWKHIQREVKRDKIFIKQSLSYYRHLLNELEKLKMQLPDLPMEYPVYGNKEYPERHQLFRKLINIFKRPGSTKALNQKRKEVNKEITEP